MPRDKTRAISVKAVTSAGVYRPQRCCLAMVASDVVVAQYSMSWANTAALGMSGRGLVRKAPQAVHRQQVALLLVVPLRFIFPPQ